MAGEIRWTLAPAPAADVLALSDEDVMLAALVESDSYRNLSLSGVNALHQLHQEQSQLRSSHNRLLAEFRRARAANAERAA